ncbi:Uncharacterised protein [Mycobacterium tuberculosis]|nr:Uncharacterised protein [Mycobacterium tuberculosis]
MYSAGHLRMPGMREPSAGCAPTMRMAGFFSFRKRETPVMVPVVPIALTKWVTLPLVSAQISGPVVS